MVLLCSEPEGAILQRAEAVAPAKQTQAAMRTGNERIACRKFEYA